MGSTIGESSKTCQARSCRRGSSRLSLPPIVSQTLPPLLYVRDNFYRVSICVHESTSRACGHPFSYGTIVKFQSGKSGKKENDCGMDV